MPDSLPASAEFRTDTLVIGAGQAGLAAAYYLQRAGVACIVLERAGAVGQQWATRYDSLRLFSPAWASGLPGLPWPGPPRRYPTKDEAADYLRRYAAHFAFDIRLNQPVVRLGGIGGSGFEVLTADGTRYIARRVVVCTGGFAAAKVPAWAATLPPEVQQLHSSVYQRPEQLPGAGPVAVVGSGNSAVQIAAELAATGRPVYVAFDERIKAVPNNMAMWTTMSLLGLFRASRHGLVGGFMHRQPEPVVAGPYYALRRLPTAHFIGRARQVRGAALEGLRATTPPLQAVVWATGFRPDYGWIDLPVLDAQGHPRHHRGLSEVPGLAFLGLPWLDSRGSALMGGVARDAQRVIKQLLTAPATVERKKGNQS
ncbi:FAD-dependent oxidoreductase [Hymenobacter gummosus]|uniref:FAD-dependent oxidoreductase n=1 Tax=Hymenobacter gummosus TaxID=1776032 RepID=A0A3S0JH75_9BACT|nr:FAD-dependent oxidoreductase [Hymenobacter gummosus]RTQ49758.1 FAD-dependent oxidoreductase [Hymenobacter gummosus]